MKAGMRVSALLHFVRDRDLHGIPSELIRLQAGLTGIPLIQEEVREDFEGIFKATISRIKGIRGMIFGDIYLREHREWLERVCRDLSITPCFPLWDIPTEELFKDFIRQGFEAVVVSARTGVIGRQWIGQRVDEAFLDYLKGRNGVDVCGENGEYHTLVISGPMFNDRIVLHSDGTEERDGHWFLNIRRFRTEGVRGV